MPFRKTICFIPARSGSVGIKNKNLQKIHGKNLIEITIKLAKKAKIFSHIILSSDSDKILSHGKKNNIISVKRSKKASSNISKSEEALLEFINNTNIKFDHIFLLQVTSPMRKVETVRSFADFCFKNNLNTSFTVSVNENVISKKNKRFVNLEKNQNIRQRQERKSYIYENGLIYYVKKKYFLKKKAIFNDKSKYFVTEKYESIDINDKMDLKISNLIYKKI